MDFEDDLFENPPEKEIDFGIDILRDNRYISIPPYRMSFSQLKS